MFWNELDIIDTWVELVYSPLQQKIIITILFWLFQMNNDWMSDKQHWSFLSLKKLIFDYLRRIEKFNHSFSIVNQYTITWWHWLLSSYSPSLIKRLMGASWTRNNVCTWIQCINQVQYNNSSIIIQIPSIMNAVASSKRHWLIRTRTILDFSIILVSKIKKCTEDSNPTAFIKVD